MKPGAEHVGPVEAEGENVIFGTAFDSCPHRAAPLGRVGSGSGDVAEGAGGIGGQTGSRGGERVVVGDAGVGCFVQPQGRDAEAEEARGKSGELRLERLQVQEILVRQVGQLGMGTAGG